MISLIIPSHGESVGLWSTVASAKSEFEHDAIEHEIIVVLDEQDSSNFPKVAHCFTQSDFAKVIYANVGGPQLARNLGASKSRGDFLFFADAHCVFPRRFFRDLLEGARREGADAVFGATRFLDRKSAGSTMGWDDVLWGMEVNYPKNNVPFPIVSVGHGAFGIKREAFFDVGGYWGALKGFGGEETQLNLKLWMFGRKLMMFPSVFHWHFSPPGERRDFSMYAERDFVRNFLLVAAAYGGESWAQKVRESFKIAYWKFEELFPDLLDEVLASPEVEAERFLISERAVYKNFEDLRAMFKRAGVFN